MLNPEEEATDQLSNNNYQCCVVKARDIVRLAELDNQLRALAKQGGVATPRSGWVMTVRLAMGMSSKALGKRLDMSPQGVRKAELAEAKGTITLNTLARVADGLDCELRYVLIPRTSLVDQVLNRARERSMDTSGLDSKRAAIQALDPEGLLRLADLLAGANRRGFW